jgi:hypothetical protein
LRQVELGFVSRGQVLNAAPGADKRCQSMRGGAH